MRTDKAYVILVALVPLALLAQPIRAGDAPKGPVKVFILAGQSNMEGHGGLRTLDAPGEHPTQGALLKKIRKDDGSLIVRDDVFMYYQRGDGCIKAPLTFGQGAGEDRIGPELMFGINMSEYFEEPVLLIKTAWGGKDLYCDFRPPSAGKPAYEIPGKPRELGVFYRKMVEEVHQCLDQLDTHFPQFKGQLEHAVYMGKCEVTQEQYLQVTGTNPSNFKGRDLPVETGSWDEAQAFCKKIGEKTGESVRLPSEAEWEYTCRAGTRTRFCSGDADADLESVAWYSANSIGKTHSVGEKASNAWGVHDMHGNVWEWCGDWFETYKAEATTDPKGPTEGLYRVLRSGSWNFNPRRCRSALRIGSNPGLRDYHFDFQVVWLVPRTP